MPHEVHERVFGWVLALIAERGLVRGERIGVDASTLEANAALRQIVRHDTGEGYREMLERMPRKAGSRPRRRRTSSGSVRARATAPGRRGLGWV